MRRSAEKTTETVRLVKVSETFAFTFRQLCIKLLRYCTTVKLKDANVSRLCCAKALVGS